MRDYGLWAALAKPLRATLFDSKAIHHHQNLHRTPGVTMSTSVNVDAINP